MKYLLLVSIVVLSLQTTAIGQDLDWALKPVITDVDKLSSSIHDGPRILMVAATKDGKAGVKNIKNKVIVPFEYERSEIWIDGKYGAGRTGRDMYFADAKGMVVDYESVVDVEYDIWNGALHDKREEEAMVRLASKHPDIKVKRVGEGFGVFNIQSQTLMHTFPGVNHLKDVSFTGEGLLLYVKSNWGNGLDVYNLDGELFKTYDDTHYLKGSNGRYVTIAKDKKYGLLDAGMNELLPYEYESIKLYKHGYYLKSATEAYLVDGQDKKHPVGLKANCWPIKGTNLIRVKDEASTQFIDLQSGDVQNYDFVVGRGTIGKSILQVKESTGKQNLFHLNEGNLLLSEGLDLLKCQGQYAIGMNGVLEKGKRFDSVNAKKKIFDSKGQLILEREFTRIKIIGNLFFIVYAQDELPTIYDSSGGLVYTLADGEQIRISDDTWSFAIYEKGSKPDYMLATEFDATRSGNTYSNLSKAYKNKAGQFYYIATNDGLSGVVTREGKVVVPIVLDSAELGGRGDRYVVAQYKGKFGILHNPIYIE